MESEHKVCLKDLHNLSSGIAKNKFPIDFQ